jgi:hypothetical protein
MRQTRVGEEMRGAEKSLGKSFTVVSTGRSGQGRVVAQDWLV